jgi:hypothetical protein
MSQTVRKVGPAAGLLASRPFDRQKDSTDIDMLLGREGEDDAARGWETMFLKDLEVDEAVWQEHQDWRRAMAFSQGLDRPEPRRCLFLVLFCSLLCLVIHGSFQQCDIVFDFKQLKPKPCSCPYILQVAAGSLRLVTLPPKCCGMGGLYVDRGLDVHRVLGAPRCCFLHNRLWQPGSRMHLRGPGRR